MKVNPILTICSLLTGAVLFYAYRVCGAETTFSLLGSGTATLWLFTILALNIPDFPRRAVLLKTIAGILLAVTFPANILFAWLGVSIHIAVIADSLAVIAWLIALYFALSGDKNSKS